LAGLNDTALEAILAAARERTFPTNHVLFRTGEPAEQLFMLLKGSIRFGRVSPAGREVVMGVLVAGDVCGLGSLIREDMHYLGTAVALESSSVLVWNRLAIHRLATMYPLLSQNALHVALGYVAHFIDRQLRLASSSAEERLAGTLIKLGTKSGHATPQGLEVAVTNELLASLADVSPFTTSRAMQTWTRSGAITKSRGRVRITAPEKLLVG
jgi:CRP/FNR family transcriptional regulator